MCMCVYVYFFRQWSVEPNNANGRENCVEIHTDGLYNDRICTAKAGYICEYPLQNGMFIIYVSVAHTVKHF